MDKGGTGGGNWCRLSRGKSTANVAGQSGWTSRPGASFERGIDDGECAEVLHVGDARQPGRRFELLSRLAADREFFGERRNRAVGSRLCTLCERLIPTFGSSGPAGIVGQLVEALGRPGRAQCAPEAPEDDAGARHVLPRPRGDQNGSHGGVSSSDRSRRRQGRNFAQHLEEKDDDLDQCRP